jgi:hypothetical protein
VAAAYCYSRFFTQVACIGTQTASFCPVLGADPAGKTEDSRNKAPLCRVNGSIGTILSASALTRHRPHQAMISAIIVLSLLSLLVATEPEHADTSAPPSPEPPLRPAGKKPRAEETAKPDRVAA